MNCVNGAYVRADSATDAFFIIHNGKIVLHCDRRVRTRTSALRTAYASVRAHFSRKDTLIVVGASDSNYRSLFHHTNGSVRTVFSAKTATVTEA